VLKLITEPSKFPSTNDQEVLIVEFMLYRVTVIFSTVVHNVIGTKLF